MRDIGITNGDETKVGYYVGIMASNSLTAISTSSNAVI
jgi:hypothetical protein